MSFFLIAPIGLSDILDGWIARKMNSETRLGVILDVAADCVIVFVIQGFLLAADDWPLYLLVISVASIISFAICVLHRGNVQKNVFSRYIGAVLLAAFLVVSFCNAIDPYLWMLVRKILDLLLVVYILVSIIENLKILSTVSWS